MFLDPGLFQLDPEWFLTRLVANHRGVPCYGARVGCSLCGGVLVKLGCFAEALAFEEIGGQVVLQAVAARAAANSDHDAHTFLATSEARAFEGLHCVMAQQAAAARAAAYFPLVALSCLATSEAQAFEFLFWVHRWLAAAAPAAAFFEGYSCKYFLGHMFESCWIFAGILLLGLWKFTEENSSTIGMKKAKN